MATDVRTTTFGQATALYEKWLSRQLTIVPADLDLKHKAMTCAIFPFLRATFYRWAQLWPEVCPECADAPEVLAVGDLHVENFGTWRDLEGRLAWGINDFDEAARMPYAIDLVRLAASAHLAIDVDKLRIEHAEACSCILRGYKEGMEAGGMPWVVAGRHPWLHEMVNPALRDPAAFWDKMAGLPAADKIPAGARRALESMMPRPVSKFRTAKRVAGLGSLGRQRFVGIAEYAGGSVCREAKATAPSAWDWARGGDSRRVRYQKALEIAIRAPDPFVRLKGKWIIRRLAPDCSRIDLSMFPGQRDESKLLHAMGWETANLHLGSGRTARILSDLRLRPAKWLHKAASAMVGSTIADWTGWRTGSTETKG